MNDSVYSREYIQKMFIRVCRDSGFTMEYIKATIFAGEILKISPIEVWTSFGSLDTMEEIAKGIHPVLKRQSNG